MLRPQPPNCTRSAKAAAAVAAAVAALYFFCHRLLRTAVISRLPCLDHVSYNTLVQSISTRAKEKPSKTTTWKVLSQFKFNLSRIEGKNESESGGSIEGALKRFPWVDSPVLLLFLFT